MDRDFLPHGKRPVTPVRRSLTDGSVKVLQHEHAITGAHQPSLQTAKARRSLHLKIFSPRLKWAILAGMSVLLLVALPLVWPTGGASPNASVLGSSATLKASKKIFAVSEDPSFRLEFAKPQVGWLDLPGMVGRAAAAEAVRTSVYYDNGQQVNIPVQLRPDSLSNFTVQLKPDSRVKPGRYSVMAEWGSGKNVHSVTQNFAWGVLAINTNQSAYTPGQTVNIQMGVLNSRGNTICDAPLQLTITAPDGTSTRQGVNRSGDCKGDSYVAVPDYTANYVPPTIGHYQLDLRLSTSDYHIVSGFDVKKVLPFNIVRQGPSRIYPFHPYNMEMTVTPQSDFKGTVTETLPGSFSVPDNGGGHITKQKQAVTISWQAHWQAGKTYRLSYQFKAPLVSPAFYYIQPLQLKATSGQSYKEPREWQIASDAVITLIQEASADLASTTSTGHIAFSSTAGNTLILNLAQTANNQGISAITDSAGNTWTYPATGDSQNPPAAYMGTVNNQFAMAYAVNAAAVSWIQIDIPAANKMTYDITEFSNIASSTAVDQSAAVGQKAPGGTTAPYYQSTPTITTTNANDLIIGGINPTGTNTFSDYGAGYTALAAGKALGAAYQVVNATGSYTITIGVSASKSAGTGIMAFKAASGGGGSSCTVAAPSIAFVQQAEQNSGTNTTSMTTSFSSTSTAGNLLVALVSVYGGISNAAAAISSVTGGGNSWTYPTADPQDNPFAQAASGSNSYIAVAYAANASATSSVTVNLSVNLPVAVVIAEFSGVATSSPVDISKGQVGAASTTPTTPTITTTNANDLIIGAVSETSTPAISRTTSGYTDFPLMTANNDPFDGGSAWQVVSATGNYSVAWSAPGNHAYGSGIIAFKQATGSSTPSMDLMMRGGNYFCNGTEQGFFWAS